MEETQRARSHTVTTTASSFAENFSTTSSSFSYDRDFLRTLPGLLIVAEIVSASGRAGGRRRGAGGPRAVLLAWEPVHILPTASEERFRLSLAVIPRCRTQRPPLRSESRLPWALLGERVMSFGRTAGEKPDLLGPLRGRGVSPERDARWTLSLCS